MRIAFALLLLSLCANATFAQDAGTMPKGEEALYEQFDKGGASATAALNQVIKNAETTSATLLYMASGAALGAKRLEDAGFLFYVAQLRARFDTDAFPAKGQGSEDPGVLFGALNSTLGQSINPAVMAQPSVFKRVLMRVEQWNPKVPAGYSPGWEYTQSVTTNAPRAAHDTRKKQTVQTMRGLSTLLSDPEYSKNFRLVQQYNGVAPGPRPTLTQYQSATARLKVIEQKKNIAGPFTPPPGGKP